MFDLRFTLIGLMSGLLAALAATPTLASDNPRYAAFVVEQNTGEILHARRASASRHPASLTKMMTLYMLFEAIESGEVALDDEIAVSADAADEPCSCLGLEEGDALPVETAIRALIIRSANDVALAVGEHLAGDEAGFAAAMTERARALGLENTVFRNASGLPDRRQVTTARDMARLGVALHRDYPQYFHYFGETRLSWDGRVHRNHNSLVGRVDGVDGLKTGYIRASGFNLVVSAERGEDRLIAVVMGGPSAASRDTHAEELLEAGFAALDRRADGRFVAAMAAPRINPARRQEEIRTEIAALGLAAPQEMGSAQSAPPLRVELVGEDETAALRRSSPEPSLPVSQWSIQVGAYGAETAARVRLAAVAESVALPPAASPAALALDRDGGVLWRARFEGLGEADARRICAVLEGRGEACYPVAPGA
jgi:D-alanyl-D-alanine carboxypeptidase